MHGLVFVKKYLYLSVRTPQKQGIPFPFPFPFPFPPRSKQCHSFPLTPSHT